MEKKSNAIKKEINANGSKKLTYEQLEQVANNLSSQSKQMYHDLMEARQVIANFNDIGMLLSIIDKSEHFEPKFIDRCAQKVQSVVTAMLDESEAAEKEEEKK